MPVHSTDWRRQPRTHKHNLVGRRFGRLLVLCFGKRTRHAKGTNIYWLCRCDCGRECLVATGKLLAKVTGTKSCGCLSAEAIGKVNLTHGMCKTREYKTWRSLKGRCCNPNNPKYPVYGGRGITVCDRWLNSFENFFADVGPIPSRQHSIDRIDVNGNYEPGNVRWADRFQQMRNTRRNRKFAWNGREETVADWADLLGISAKLIWSRLCDGWTINRALTEPSNVDWNRRGVVTHKGRTQTIMAWAAENGICPATIRQRLRKGWSLDDVFSPARSRRNLLEQPLQTR